MQRLHGNVATHASPPTPLGSEPDCPLCMASTHQPVCATPGTQAFKRACKGSRQTHSLTLLPAFSVLPLHAKMALTWRCKHRCAA